MKLGPYELGYNDTNQGIYTGDAQTPIPLPLTTPTQPTLL